MVETPPPPALSASGVAFHTARLLGLLAELPKLAPPTALTHADDAGYCPIRVL